MENKMKQCKFCGETVAKNAKSCPHCGAKLKHRHVILGTLLAAFGILLFIGAIASSNDEPKKVESSTTVAKSTTSESQASTEQTELPEQTEFTVGDKVELNDIIVTLVDVSTSTGENSLLLPDDGKEYIICEFEVENNSKRDILVSTLASFEAYVDDFSTLINYSAIASSGLQQLDGTVAAGKKIHGAVGYEVDEGWEKLEIRFSPDFWSGRDIVFTVSNQQ